MGRLKQMTLDYPISPYHETYGDIILDLELDIERLEEDIKADKKDLKRLYEQKQRLIDEMYSV